MWGFVAECEREVCEVVVATTKRVVNTARTGNKKFTSPQRLGTVKGLETKEPTV